MIKDENKIMKELILIDGNYWIFSSYYATAAMGNYMTNREGIPTNAVYGFAQTVEKVLRDNPAYIMVAFDAKGKTFRSDKLEEYKATRKKAPDELIQQFPIVREYLEAHNIVHKELQGYEGDDIIGTVAKMAAAQGCKVSIYTGDKDMLQLVSENISVFKRNVKTKEYDEITPTVFYENYQIQPEQMRDFLGLMGDASDNIPGVPGVGEKTALKLLKEYGSIENIIENKDNIKGKLGEKIRDNSKIALLSKEIATIKQDVPMELNLEELKNTKQDYDTLADFFRRYDMQSLLKRMAIEDTSVEIEETTVEIVSTMPSITETSALVVGVYENNYHKSPILGYAVYNTKQSLFISVDDALKDENFKSYLKNKEIAKLGYDIKKNTIASQWHGMPIHGFSFDLQLASYILNPSLKDEVKNVCEFYQYYDVMYDDEVYGKGAKKTIPEASALANHLIKQAKAIYTLQQPAIDKLQQEQQYELYKDVELPIAHILGDMEFQGAKVDVNFLKEMQQRFSEKISALETKITDLAGRSFNIASPKQLGEVLFDTLQLPHAKKTKTGYSTSVDVLQKLRDVHPIIDLILEYRTLTKLNSTYIVGLQEQVFLDGKIHTIYNQALTQTGRLSSIDPNLQNIPIKTEEGKLIRKAFIPEYDYLVSFDYSQIELRVLAHLAGATSLIHAFNNNEDIHNHTASEVFGVSEEEVDDTMRRNAKAVNFGIIYGMSDFGLSEQIDVSVANAKTYIQKYFQQFPEIKAYMDKNIDFCKEHGYVSTILNRKRYIREINEKNYMRQELGKRLAMNSPIQGSAADILKLAMIQVDTALKEQNLESKMILQVHDELIFDVKEQELQTVMNIVKNGMESAFKMQVELQADGAYAKNWYELK